MLNGCLNGIKINMMKRLYILINISHTHSKDAGCWLQGAEHFYAFNNDSHKCREIKVIFGLDVVFAFVFKWKEKRWKEKRGT